MPGHGATPYACETEVFDVALALSRSLARLCGPGPSSHTGAHDPGPRGSRRLRDGPADPLPPLAPGPGRVVVLPPVRIPRGVGHAATPAGARRRPLGREG